VGNQESFRRIGGAAKGLGTEALALLIHAKQPARAGLGAILRERHGPSIASSDDDTAAAV
jgi:hypothetical protein